MLPWRLQWHDDFYSELEQKYGKDVTKTVANSMIDAIDYLERVGGWATAVVLHLRQPNPCRVPWRAGLCCLAVLCTCLHVHNLSNLCLMLS
jgi:hypothetical protein